MLEDARQIKKEDLFNKDIHLLKNVATKIDNTMNKLVTILNIVSTGRLSPRM